MIRRRLLFAAVLVATALALAAAVCARTPDRGLPTVALDSMLVWRAEVGAIVFVVGYGAIVAARLAFHGHTFTRVGSSGIEIPLVGSANARGEEMRMTTTELAVSIAALGRAVGELEERVLALEHPTQLVLRSRNEEI